MKNFLKKFWPDIVYVLLFAGICCLSFVPMFEVVTKDADKVKNYFDLSLFSFLKGSTINGSTFKGNLLLFIAECSLVVAFILYIISTCINAKHQKASLVLNYISFIFNIFDFFAVIFLYAYAPYLNSGLDAIKDFHEINVISWSYGLYIACLGFMLLVVLRKVFANTKFTIYEISEIAILCALALVLDKVKIPVGVTGGSINASAVPLFIIAIRHGPIKGLISSSIVFGLISCLLDGYGIQTYPLDYLIAFSGYASVGLFMYIFKKHTIKERDNIEFACLICSFILGSIVSFITRMVGHTLSSMIFYQYTFEEAFIYNIAYVPLSVFGSALIAIFLAKPIQIINHKFPIKIEAK